MQLQTEGYSGNQDRHVTAEAGLCKTVNRPGIQKDRNGFAENGRGSGNDLATDQSASKSHKAVPDSGWDNRICKSASKLVTETMLIRGLNDNDDCVKETADFLHALQPNQAYLSIPTRPPAKRRVRGPDEAALNRIYQLLADKVKQVECLTGYEGDAFAFTGEIERDILSITAVHPMREEAVRAMLFLAESSWEVVDRLVARGDLAQTTYDGHIFYLRRFTEGPSI